MKLIKEIERNEKRKKEQADKGLDAIDGYFVLCKLTDDGIKIRMRPEPPKLSSSTQIGNAAKPSCAK